jgi:hypothetical protein
MEIPKSDFLGRTWLQEHFLKALQFLNRPGVVVLRPETEVACFSSDPSHDLSGTLKCAVQIDAQDRVAGRPNLGSRSTSCEDRDPAKGGPGIRCFPEAAIGNEARVLEDCM